MTNRENYASFTPLVRLVLASVSLALWASFAVAQIPGSGDDQPDSAERTVVDVLDSESIATELNLNNGQVTKIREAIDAYRTQTAAVETELKQKIESAGSLGEKLRLRASLKKEERERITPILQATETQLLESLSPEQRSVVESRVTANRAESPQTAVSASETSPAASASTTTSSPATPNASSPPPTVTVPAGSMVASFGVKSNSDATAKSAGDNSDSRTADQTDSEPQETSPRVLSFNFHRAPWTEVLKLFASASGLTLHLRATPPGDFTYYDPQQYTPEKALDVMNRYLLQEGFLLIRHDRFLTVVDASKGVPPNLIETVTPEQLARRADTEMLTVVLPLGDRDVTKAVEETRQLLGPQGKVTPLASANSLVLTDIAGNLRRVQKLLEPPPQPEAAERTFQAFSLEHISVNDAAPLIRQLFNLKTGVENVSASASGESSRSSRSGRSFGRGGFDPRMMFGGGGGGGGDREGSDSRGASSTNGSSTSNSSTFQSTVTIATDLRTNTLLVTATAAEMKLVTSVIEGLDQPAAGGRGEGQTVRNDAPYLQVYTLASADPIEVSKTLGVLHPGMVVNEDGRARRLHVWATAEQHREIAQHIQQLDGQMGGESVAVIPLGSISATEAGTLIIGLFSADGNQAPAVQISPNGRELIVRGSALQIGQIRTLLGQVDDGASQLASQETGPVRTIPLGGQDPQRIAELIQQLWSARNANPIRIISPDDARRLPRQPEEAPPRGNAPPASTDPQTQLNIRPQVRPAATAIVLNASQRTETTAPAAASQPATPSEEARPEEAADKTEANQISSPPILLSVGPDGLTLISDDLEALDRLSSLIDRLTQSMPARTTWSVFYLKAADATATAILLGELLPNVGVIATTTGLGSLQASQSLRIIPETRTNSLFVSGPREQVRDVENLLQVLDADELPNSVRERVPRLIPVQYSNVNDVAAVVRDVYQDLLNPPSNDRRNRGNSGGGNPFSTMFSGANNTPAPPTAPVTLTLGVDARTSQLVVSASDSLFREIESLVQTLDQAAREAQRTVRVVNVENANSAVVQQALTSLFPQVTVSTTASTTNSRTAPSNADDRNRNSNSSSGSSDADQERIERIRSFMQMRDQFRQGGGGPPGGGDRPSFGSPFGRRGDDGGSSRGRRGGRE